jgi:hypothetical protein
MRIPSKIKVLKEFTFDKYGFHFICTIKEGEIGTYFKHNDCYTFPERNGCVPYIDRKNIMTNFYFEKIYEDGNK